MSRSTDPTPKCLWILVLAAACASDPAGRPRPPEVSGKPVAPIRIEATEAVSDGAGRPVEVEVSFTLLRDAEEVTLHLTPEQGMTLIPSATIFSFGAGRRDDTFSEKVSVRPDREGVLYLKVLVSAVFDGTRMARAGSIPVRTSPDAFREIVPEGRIRTAADGTRVLERPLEGSRQ